VYGRTEAVKALVKAGASVAARNNAGETPLIRSCRWGHRDAAAALIAGSANVSLQDHVCAAPPWAQAVPA
jgi:ankyrin repeat protein